MHIHRIHENKRQLLNIFYIIDLYDQLIGNPNLDAKEEYDLRKDMVTRALDSLATEVTEITQF